MPGVAEFDQRDNPYRAMAVDDGMPRVHDSLEDQVQLLGAFVGPNANYFLRRWLPRLEDPEANDVSWNWAALFFGATWMAYRKMYRTMFLFACAATAISTIQQVVFILVLHRSHVPEVAWLVEEALLSIVCALCGNAWYLSHAQRQIEAERERGHDEQGLMYALAQRGGTSWGSAIGLTFVMGMLVSMVSFVIGIAIAIVAMPA